MSKLVIVTAMHSLLAIQERARREPHHFLQQLRSDFPGECALCGKHRDDSSHQVEPDQGAFELPRTKT